MLRVGSLRPEGVWVSRHSFTPGSSRHALSVFSHQQACKVERSSIWRSSFPLIPVL